VSQGRRTLPARECFFFLGGGGVSTFGTLFSNPEALWTDASRLLYVTHSTCTHCIPKQNILRAPSAFHHCLRRPVQEKAVRRADIPFKDREYFRLSTKQEAETQKNVRPLAKLGSSTIQIERPLCFVYQGFNFTKCLTQSTLTSPGDTGIRVTVSDTSVQTQRKARNVNRFSDEFRACLMLLRNILLHGITYRRIRLNKSWMLHFLTVLSKS
jgi:hypothetical protein